MAKRALPFPQTKRASVIDGRYLHLGEWRAELAQVQFLKEQIYLEGEIGPYTDGAVLREEILRRLRPPLALEGINADT